jgi:hypothetical protein
MQRMAVTVQFAGAGGVAREFRNEVEVDGPSTDIGEWKFAAELFEYTWVELNWATHRVDVKIAGGPVQAATEQPIAAASHLSKIFDGPCRPVRPLAVNQIQISFWGAKLLRNHRYV